MDPTGSFTTLDDWLPWLETLSPREIVLGLERVDEVLSDLQLDRIPLTINVAGTNGKGSCIAMLEALLNEGGYRTGCYTSPHLVRFNERMRIAGESATDKQIIAGLQRVQEVRGDTPLTFFEFGTLAALVVFQQARVDAMLLEVGVGGRLDAVNAVTPDGCLITNVSLDHCAWLGDNVESIAAEKAGIMRSGIPVVYGSTAVPEAIFTRAREVDADLKFCGRDFQFGSHAEQIDTWSWRGRDYQFEALKRPALTGEMQLQNASAVLALIEGLGLHEILDARIVDRAFTGLRLPGRLQWIDQRPRWLLDVAHNAAASDVLARAIVADAPDSFVVGIVGMLGDKDVAAWVAPLQDLVDLWIAVTVDSSRVLPAPVLARELANHSGSPCLAATSLDEAMAVAASRVGDNDLIVVTGSFYVVGPALAALEAGASL